MEATVVTLTGAERRAGGARGCGEGNRGGDGQRGKVSIMEDEQVVEIYVA